MPMSGINFVLLCEQAIFEEFNKESFYNIVNGIRVAQTQYKIEKKKDTQVALNNFNVERIRLRKELKELVWNQPLNPDGSLIATEEQFDNYIFNREQRFPGIVLLHKTLLPRD